MIPPKPYIHDKRLPGKHGSATAQTPPPNQRAVSGTSIREETPLELRTCKEHDSTFDSIITQITAVREVLKKMKTSQGPAEVRDKATLMLGDIIFHMEELQLETEQMAENQPQKESNDMVPNDKTNQRISVLETSVKSMEQSVLRVSEMVTETFHQLGHLIKGKENQGQTYAQAAATAHNNPISTEVNSEQNRTDKTHCNVSRLKEHQSESQQIRKYANTQIRKYADTQICKYANTQIRKYANMQIKPIRAE
jgi:hypothetical protein